MADNDNIGKRILQILKEKRVKPTPFEESKEISRGYFKKVADNGGGLGTDIVEKILLQFPDTDAFWLITGKRAADLNSQEKHTPVQIEAAVAEDPDARMARIEQDIVELKYKSENLEVMIEEVRRKKAGTKPAKKVK